MVKDFLIIKLTNYEYFFFFFQGILRSRYYIQNSTHFPLTPEQTKSNIPVRTIPVIFHCVKLKWVIDIHDMWNAFRIKIRKTVFPY